MKHSFLAVGAAALLFSACDSSVTAPASKYGHVVFQVVLSGDTSTWGKDGYVAIIDGTQTVSLSYQSQNSLALERGEHALALRRAGLAADLLRPPSCTAVFGLTRKFNVAIGKETTLILEFNCAERPPSQCLDVAFCSCFDFICFQRSDRSMKAKMNQNESD